MDSYDEPGRSDGWLPHPVDPGLQTYLSEVAGVRRLSVAEQARLRELAAGGDEDAAQRLAEANLELVVHVAREYAGRAPDLVELLLAGNRGMVRVLRDPAALASDTPLRDLMEREIRASMERFAGD
jgi:DNA-directed RNA polymerase sigma subunit (sigma70/sigma32)